MRMERGIFGRSLLFRFSFSSVYLPLLLSSLSLQSKSIYLICCSLSSLSLLISSLFLSLRSGGGPGSRAGDVV